MDRMVKHNEQSTVAPPYELYARWKRNEILLKDYNVGYGVHLDTANPGDESIGVNPGWAVYNDTGGTVNGVAGARGITITLDTTDNDETWVQASATTGAPFIISDTAGSNKQLLFCAEFKFSSVANSISGGFVGLMDPGAAAADTITDAGALADKNYIGFFRPEGDGDGLDFVYKADGQTAQTHISDAVTLVADTYVTVGFWFDGSQIIPFYGGEWKKSNKITATNIAAATFPDGDDLAPIFGLKNGGTTSNSMTVRFLECQQYT